MSDEKKSFVIYQDWMNMVLDLPDEHALDLARTIFAHCVGREYNPGAVASAVFLPIRDRIDEDVQAYRAKCEKNAENIRKRWNNNRIPSNTTVYDRIDSNNERILIYDNDNDHENEDDHGNDYDNALPTEGKKEDTKVSKKEPRHKYGMYNNVLLSDTDMEKLKDEFPGDWADRIERLSEYIESTGKKYKNHLATMRAWARKNNDKRRQSSDYAFSVIDNMDFSGVGGGV